MIKSNIIKVKSKNVKVPILNNSAAAGFNNPEYDSEFEYVDIPDTLLKSNKNPFLYKISGNSMSPTINDNELVIIDLDKIPKSNDIVIAIIDGDLLCKRFIHKSAFATLVSDNIGYDTIVLTEEKNIKILGVVKVKYTIF